MHKKKSIIILSCISIIVSLLLIVTSTMALFTDQITINHHLQAGTLKMTLVRENLKVKTLDETGCLIEKENPNEKDFTNETNDNIFDITKDQKIAPGCKYEAQMRLENHSDVAYEYYFEIVVNTKDLNLNQQLKVTITKEDGVPQVFYLNNGLMIGNKTQTFGQVLKDDTGRFKIAIEFENKADNVNNLAQDENLVFDVIVYAIQVA